MACTLYVAWDGRLAAYDFGAGHPMAPARVELTIELARAFGLFAEAGVSVESPVAATDAELELVHDPRYIAGVRLAGEPEPDPSVLDFGLGTEDDPVFAGMHDVEGLAVSGLRKLYSLKPLPAIPGTHCGPPAEAGTRSSSGDAFDCSAVRCSVQYHAWPFRGSDRLCDTRAPS